MKKRKGPLRTFTVVMEHDCPSGRDRTCLVLSAHNFDAAVVAARKGLRNAVPMSVAVEAQLPSLARTLFEEN